MPCASNCSGACYGSGSGSRSTTTDRGGSVGARTTGCSRGVGQHTCNGCGFDCAVSGGCSGKCTGSCGSDCSGCTGSCSGSCNDTCKDTCKGRCLGSCAEACKGTCKGMCLGGCSTACSGTCNHLCNTTCTNSVAESAYNFLNNLKDKLTKDDYGDYLNHLAADGIVLNYLDSEDMNYMFTLLKEEGRRRHLQLNSDGSPIGQKGQVFDYNTLTTEQINKIGGIDNKVIANNFVDDQEIKTISNLLIANANKTTGLSSVNSELVEGGIVHRAIGVALIKKMLEAYQDMVGVPSVSQSSGVQEN